MIRTFGRKLLDRSKFYECIRTRSAGLFGGSLSQAQVEGMEGIIAAMEEVGDGRAKTLAYALATAYHETGRKMVPVREGFATTNEGAIKAVAKLAQRLGAGCAPDRYGKPTGPYGHCYYGRGHVQLTWHENYLASSGDAGVDLEREPDKMLDPVISARVLIKGLIDGRWNGKGKGIAHYLPEDGQDNLKDARRTVNITDKWDVIAGYYAAFLEAIVTAGGWVSEPASPRANHHEALAASSTVGDSMPAAAISADISRLEMDADLLAWVEKCPGDIREIGLWLASAPQRKTCL